jgi:hypothetical protein
MELDPAAWVVHRYLVDPRLDELDTNSDTNVDTPLHDYALATDFGHSPLTPIGLPADLWGLDTWSLERLARETRSLLAATDEVTSAG